MVAKQKTHTLEQRLSANLSARRHDLGMTQAQVAETVGVDTETLSRFERGRHLPSLFTLEKIAKALNLTVADLLAEQPPKLIGNAEIISASLDRLSANDQRFVLTHMKHLIEHLKRK